MNCYFSCIWFCKTAAEAVCSFLGTVLQEIYSILRVQKQGYFFAIPLSKDWSDRNCFGQNKTVRELSSPVPFALVQPWKELAYYIHSKKDTVVDVIHCKTV